MRQMTRLDLRIRDLLDAGHRFNANRHVRFFCEGAQIGWLRPGDAQRLLRWQNVFVRDAEAVHIASSLRAPAARSAAIDRVVKTLYGEGVIRGWRDERYAVSTAFDEPALFHIERAAARYFGVTTYAAHVNGYCGSGHACEMWIARRAPTKPIEPGLLDNVVAGGLCAGTAPLDAIVREAWEEAGMPAELARCAMPTGTIDILREVAEGVQAETIFVHDLELPASFEPVNQDGEVAEFRCLPVRDVIAILGEDRLLTLDASLVVLSFLARRGYLDEGAEEIVSMLSANRGC
jgi:8-oxo-dGTP pyrophosphatase MutT (NUDIX family)